MGIGDRIKQRRIELGMSQQELADAMGYTSKSTINKIELGKNDVSQSKVVKFSKVLNTTPSFLMDWELENENESNSINNVQPIILNNEELNHIEKYRSLNKDGKEVVDIILEREYQFLEYRKKIEDIKGSEK